MSGLIDRDAALEEMKKPLYDDLQLKNDTEYIARKLNVSLDEFYQIISQPNKRHQDYQNEEFMYTTLRDFLKKFGGLNLLKKMLR